MFPAIGLILPLLTGQISQNCRLFCRGSLRWKGISILAGAIMMVSVAALRQFAKY